MPASSRRNLVVVGAGPKGIAIAVKAKVLEEFGIPVDRVTLIEKNGVAAHWSGNFGYTNGYMKLGTPPEKDVVFPVEVDVGDAGLNRQIAQRLMNFSWNAFLTEKLEFSEWVDRGRPAPCHQHWAAYLRWVSEQLSPHVTIVSAEVVQVELTPDQSYWQLSLKHADGLVRPPISADRLMLTGPGKTRLDFPRSDLALTIPGVYDTETFWPALKRGQFAESARVAVVGSGENAASVLLALGAENPGLRRDLISPRGFIVTRAESYYENRFYSQPEKNGWSNLSLEDRIDFIGRTDLGVFSVHAMQILNEQVQHRIIPGRLMGIESKGSALTLTVDHEGHLSKMEYDRVVMTTGSDQISEIKSYFSSDTIDSIQEKIRGPFVQSIVSRLIGRDLAIEGLFPNLHLPMLAGVMQGPGFGNLSCLGRLSDRVLIRDGILHSKARVHSALEVAL